MLLFSWLASFVASAVIYSTGTLAAPAVNGTNLDGLSDQARSILARATPAAPHFVVYGDAWDGQTGPPPVSSIKGFNVYTLSFLLLAGAWDKAYEWTSLTADQRSTLKSQYASAGIKLIVSAFGSTDVPTTTNADPVATANTFAAWVKQYNLDGIDVDYEDFGAMDSGKGEAWLISFTKQLRAQLPAGQYIITHAPVAPWQVLSFLSVIHDLSPYRFQPGSRWPGGGYLKVHSQVGSLIDWYNIQFYNQGANVYTDCNGLLTTSASAWPNTAVFQIAASGVPLPKIVIGKPATASDASNGFMSTSTLASCVSQAKAKGWNGGVMVWEYPRASSSWISTVRGSAWPV